MKTLEEKAEELLAEIGVEDILFTTNEIQHQYISDLMVRFAKALLEEAAEKIPVPVNPYTLEPQEGLDDNTILHLEREYLKARKIQESILSLIPKDTTKD